MNTEVDKQELIDWISGLADQEILRQIKMLKVATESGDFWEELPEEVKQAINRAKKELDDGKGIPHDQVMKEVHDRFLK